MRDLEGEGADESPEVHDLGTPNANQNSSNHTLAQEMEKRVS